VKPEAATSIGEKGSENVFLALWCISMVVGIASDWPQHPCRAWFALWWFLPLAYPAYMLCGLLAFSVWDLAKGRPAVSVCPGPSCARGLSFTMMEGAYLSS
jgi:hypothetical protein